MVLEKNVQNKMDNGSVGIVNMIVIYTNRTFLLYEQEESVCNFVGIVSNKGYFP
jgi:hypothetical protein